MNVFYLDYRTLVAYGFFISLGWNLCDEALALVKTTVGLAVSYIGAA